jgi:hypothetical protein
MRKPHAARGWFLRGADQQEDDPRRAQTDREKNTRVLFRKLTNAQQDEWLKRLEAILGRA